MQMRLNNKQETVLWISGIGLVVTLILQHGSLYASVTDYLISLAIWGVISLLFLITFRSRSLDKEGENKRNFDKAIAREGLIILGFIFLYGSLLWIGETGGIFYSQLSQLVLISYPLYWIIRFVVWSIRVLGGLHYFENLIKDFEKKNVFFIKKVLPSLLIIWLLLLPLCRTYR